MKNRNHYIAELMSEERQQFAKLNKIVADALEEEALLTQNLSQADGDPSTFGERMADKVAEFGGSWRFILIFAGILITWIGVNSFILARNAFDPYPYILLNLLLSCLAALQAPIIMMSQNRQEAKDRKRAENDYLINLKSEIEIRHLHQKLDLSLVEQYTHLCEIQQRQIELLEGLEKRLAKLEKR